jgi:NitT/TauT family transport system ATP-binding protein
MTINAAMGFQSVDEDIDKMARTFMGSRWQIFWKIRLPNALPYIFGGMRQRASICRALIHNPSTLLMDEPFSALDAITRDDMAVELLRIWQTNRKTVIFVTHSIREAAFLSDRVLVMGRRPATIIDEVKIDLPRPRQIGMTEEENFNNYVRHLRKSIEASHVS